MNYFQYLWAAFGAYFSKQVSFRLGPEEVVITDNGGNAVHGSLAAYILAAEHVATGQVGTFSSGVFTVTIGPLATQLKEKLGLK